MTVRLLCWCQKCWVLSQPVGLDYLGELAVQIKMLLLDISDPIWERRAGKKVMKALLNILIARRRTEFTRME